MKAVAAHHSIMVSVDAERRQLQRFYQSAGFRYGWSSWSSSSLMPPRMTTEPTTNITTISLKFECRDPDYIRRRPKATSLPIQIEFPEDYPRELPKFTIDDDDALPLPIRR
jgi:hypothetical protein